MAITTKQELTGALHNILNNFVFGMVLSRITPEGGWQALTSKRATFQGSDGALLHVDLGPLIANLSNPKGRKILVEEYEKGLKRALLSEGHEVILAYCEATNQFSLYKGEPWFQFARIIRNATSHKDGGLLRLWPRDLMSDGVTTVTWHARTLDASMVGKPIDFTHHEALQLLRDQMEFASSRLA